MQHYINLNGKTLLENAVSISPSNRSFRYGDGFFETLLVRKEKIVNQYFHAERIKTSLLTLQFTIPKLFNVHTIFEQIKQLVIKNSHQQLARVRVTFFRGDGGLYDAENHFPNYIIQTYSLQTSITTLNENGLILDFFTKSNKAMDDFCNLKTNSFLTYTMAAIWAKENKLNDAIVFNAKQTIADTTIANLFIVKDNQIFTSTLSDACIAGVTRALLLKGLPKIIEKSITKNDVLEANEVFVTNAIRGVQWVKQVANASYSLGKHTLQTAAILQELQNK